MSNNPSICTTEMIFPEKKHFVVAMCWNSTSQITVVNQNLSTATWFVHVSIKAVDALSHKHHQHDQKHTGFFLKYSFHKDMWI